MRISDWSSDVCSSDLNALLTGKAALEHVHSIANITGLQLALDGKQAAGSYAAASHTHSIANVSGLQSALDGKQAAGSYPASNHTHHSEAQPPELQTLMRISYDFFLLKEEKLNNHTQNTNRDFVI